jgi:hypothetical protein
VLLVGSEEVCYLIELVRCSTTTCATARELLWRRYTLRALKGPRQLRNAASRTADLRFAACQEKRSRVLSRNRAQRWPLHAPVQCPGSGRRVPDRGVLQRATTDRYAACRSQQYAIARDLQKAAQPSASTHLSVCTEVRCLQSTHFDPVPSNFRE